MPSEFRRSAVPQRGRPIYWLTAFAATLTVAVTGCTSPAPDSKSSQTVDKAPADVDYNPQPYENIKDGGTLRYPGSVFDQGNPFHADANLTAARFWFWYNADAITYSPTGEVQYNPDYFTDVKVDVVDGNQRVTITINPKATFNDGTPIDYHAIEATWKADNGSDKKYFASDPVHFSKITSVHAGSNDKQAVIEFQGVNAWWSSLFTSFLNPKAAADPDTYNTAYLGKVQPQWGAGPYTVTSYNAKTGDATFERNPKWWGRRGKLDKRVLVGLDSAAAVNAFRNGELDYAATGTADGLKQISNVKGTQIRRGGSPFEYYLDLNARAPLLKEPAVRKAILESVDRKQIAQIAFQGLNYSEPLPGSAVLYSFQDGYHDNVSDVIKYDPAAAKQELDAAGWKAGSDGVRAKDGKRLELGYTLIGDDPLDKATGNAFAAQLKQIGVKLTIKPTSENDFDSVITGRKFDLFLVGNRSLDPFGAQYLDGFYGSQSNENLTGVGTPALDAKIKAATNIADPAKQIAEANVIEREALALYGLIPLYSGPSIYAVPEKLANVGATIFGTPLPETVGWQK
ncbi:MAG TPA: ABC transporter family substrate-binding protein [Mycobacteriales bacterium]|nr:ABC transporter family substrate-binding protein [Mycobacteriales bacterium]